MFANKKCYKGRKKFCGTKFFKIEQEMLLKEQNMFANEICSMCGLYELVSIMALWNLLWYLMALWS